MRRQPSELLLHVICFATYGQTNVSHMRQGVIFSEGRVGLGPNRSLANIAVTCLLFTSTIPKNRCRCIASYTNGCRGF